MSPLQAPEAEAAAANERSIRSTDDGDRVRTRLGRQSTSRYSQEREVGDAGARGP